MNKPFKVVFAPGCFDSFEGTQQELDALIADIQKAVSSGQLIKESVPMDEADLTDAERAAIVAQLGWDNRNERLN